MSTAVPPLSKEEVDELPAVRRVWELVGSEVVTLFVRGICSSIGLAFLAMSYGPLFNPANVAYDQPVFGAVFRFASPTAWGLAFMFCAMVMFLTAFTARAVIYTIAIVIGTVTTAAWATMIIYEAWRNPDAFLSSGAYGLYMFAFTSLIGLALSPRQLKVAGPVVVVTNNDQVLAARRIGA